MTVSGDVSDVRPSRLWRQMDVDRRRAAADAFWRDEDLIADHVQAVGLIAKQIKFRPRSVATLPLDRRARHLAAQSRAARHARWPNSHHLSPGGPASDDGSVSRSAGDSRTTTASSPMSLQKFQTPRRFKPPPARWRRSFRHRTSRSISARSWARTRTPGVAWRASRAPADVNRGLMRPWRGFATRCSASSHTTAWCPSRTRRPS